MPLDYLVDLVNIFLKGSDLWVRLLNTSIPTPRLSVTVLSRDSRERLVHTNAGSASLIHSDVKLFLDAILRNNYNGVICKLQHVMVFDWSTAVAGVGWEQRSGVDSTLEPLQSVLHMDWRTDRPFTLTLYVLRRQKVQDPAGNTTFQTLVYAVSKEAKCGCMVLKVDKKINKQNYNMIVGILKIVTDLIY